MWSTLSALFLHWLGFRRPAAYRPERHYMRGPGPKTLNRHGLPRGGARS